MQKVRWGFPLYTDFGRRIYYEDQGLQEFVRDGIGLLPSDRILDVGCGIGTLGRIVAPYLQGGWVEGVDLDSNLIMFGQQEFKDPKIRLRQGDARSLEYPAATFDIVLSMGLFENIIQKDTAPILEEMLRVLKPHGRLAILQIDVTHYISLPSEELFARFWVDSLTGMRQLGADLELQHLLAICHERKTPLQSIVYDLGGVSIITEAFISYYMAGLTSIAPLVEKVIPQGVDFSYQFLQSAGWTKDQVREMFQRTYSPAFQRQFLRTHLGEEFRRNIPIRLFLFSKE